jgi:hypothetical protein
MIWLAWRLHRAQLLTILGLVVAGAAALLYLRAGAVSYVAEHDLAGCVNLPERPASCLARTHAFQEKYSDLTKFAQAGFLLVPVILGVFCGGPLFARELEQGTHVFALTQSVSRTRWFLVKIAVALLPAIAAAGILAAALWSFISAQGYVGVRGQGLFTALTFDTSGFAPAAHTLFAVAAGIALGIITRHTVTAMAGSLGAFVVARFAGDTVRAHWLDLLPTKRVVTKINAPQAYNPDFKTMHSGYLTADGKVFSDEGPLTACIEQNHRTGDPTACYPKLGLTQQYSDVLTGGHYWTAQLIETALFGGVAAVLLGVAVVLLRKRSL